jgi:hypothetical protein
MNEKVDNSKKSIERSQTSYVFRSEVWLADLRPLIGCEYRLGRQRIMESSTQLRCAEANR